jgi:hypothetical protein
MFEELYSTIFGASDAASRPGRCKSGRAFPSIQPTLRSVLVLSKFDPMSARPDLSK